MSSSQKQDYILGFSTSCSGAISEEKLENGFKGTELRLGLPGSESPERKIRNGFFSLFGKELRDEKRSDGENMGLIDGMNASSKWGLFADLDTPEETGFGRNGKGTFLPSLGCNSSSNLGAKTAADTTPAPSKGHVVGWPPIRSFRKPTNSHQNNKEKSSASLSNYVKVSMDGAPYLRKIDLKTFSSYRELSASLGRMFSCFTLGKNGRIDGDSSSSEEYVLTYEDKDGDWMLVGDVPFEMFLSSCSRLRIVKGSEAIGFGKFM